MKKDSLLKIGLLNRLMEDIRLLYALVKDYWKGNYRSVSPWSIVVFVSGILYILIPVDILPDFIPLIGQIDDTVILLVCLYLLERDLQKYKKWKAEQ
ncbi:MAG: DUF1232 domain-containing protein [Deltaproteobacteria bacterium]|nr:DUF1232 domain-containing protein [Deltaproteobacteria bacterium]